MDSNDISFFDKKSDYSIFDRKLPHWMQSGALCFVTWRQADSLPNAVLHRLDSEIHDLLRRSNLDPDTDWKTELHKRSPSARVDTQRKLFLTRDKYLDQGHGSCLLAIKECAIEVEQSILHFDYERYFVTDIVVMPNHIHFIAAFRDDESFLKQCTDWKRFTARKINRLCDRTGKFWQGDQFDHLIRNLNSFEYFRKYIAENPIVARLPEETFRHFYKEL